MTFIMAISLPRLIEAYHVASRAIGKSITNVLQEHDLCTYLKGYFAIYQKVVKDVVIKTAGEFVEHLKLESNISKLNKTISVHLIDLPEYRK